MRRLLELENYFCNNAYKIGKIIHLYEECSSTQDVAKEIAPRCDNGVCIVALRQTKGRGRLGRAWFSPQGGLWLSIIVKNIHNPMFLNPILSLSAIEVIEQLYQLRTKIYWPNDIYIERQKAKVKSQNLETEQSATLESNAKNLNPKKIAGILTEGIHSENSVYLCGVGINVNIEKQYFEKEKLLNASSLYVESGKKVDILTFLQDFLIKFNFLYELIQAQSYEYIENSFKKYNALLSKYVKIKYMDCEYIGQVIDISISEGILVKFRNNAIKNFSAEMVESIREVDYAEVV